MDDRPMANQIKTLREAKGWLQKDVADAIAAEQGYPATVQEISRLETEKIRLTADWILRLAKVFEVSPTEILLPPGKERRLTVPLVGYIGVGRAYSWEASVGPWQPIETVEAPPDGDGTIALMVRGAALKPVYRDGDLIYVTRPPSETPASELSELVGEECVVQTRGGLAYLGTIEEHVSGSRIALSLEGSTRHVEAEWAAPVRWVRRARRGR
jgi:transcriptional regulator with XRE-family HTH domain